MGCCTDATIMASTGIASTKKRPSKCVKSSQKSSHTIRRAGRKSDIGEVDLRRDAISDEEIDPQQHEEDRDEDERQRELRAEHAPPNARLTDRLEPEVVGVEGRDAAQRRDEDEQADGGDDQQDPAAPRAPLTARAAFATRHVVTGAHCR